MMPYHRKVYGEPTRLLICHADAGDRPGRAGADRSLSRLGRTQADELAARIGGMPIVRIISGPSRRCRQTVMPLARSIGLRVEISGSLEPDADPAYLAGLLADPDTDNAVFCTHRETLLGVFAQLIDGDPAAASRLVPLPLAAAWLLRGTAAGPRRLRYLWPAREPACPAPVSVARARRTLL
jgi:phosphohistidine phosphatase SixA